MDGKGSKMNGNNKSTGKALLLNIYSAIPDEIKTSVRRALQKADYSRVEKAQKRCLIQAADEISSPCMEDIQSLDDWQRRRLISREKLQWMLGLKHPREREHLNACITGVVDQDKCRIEKVVIESIPGLWVTANFYVPNNVDGPLPCIVYLNGHSTTLDGAKTVHQTPSLWYPANGFTLLIVDPLGFGEIPGIHAGTHRLGWWHWLSRGYTPAGVEVWNAIRALDWLETRPEVDILRVGVTGLSGGGVMTQYLAALDERVAAAAPSCSTYTIGNQVSQDLVHRQCDCTFYPNVHHIDFPEVLALIAPRPLLILGGSKDPIFPPAGFREAYRRAKRIYDLYGAQNPDDSRIRLVETPAGHTDTPDSLNLTHRWMCRWLCEGSADDSRPEAHSVRLQGPDVLRCLDQLPTHAVNYHVHDVWLHSFAPSISTKTEREDRKAELIGILNSRVFGWFPKENAPFRTRRLRVKGGYIGHFSDFGAYEFDSEPGVPVQVKLLYPRDQSGPVTLVIWIKGASEHVHFPDVDEFHPLLRSYAVLLLTPRFAARPLTGAEFTRVERTAALVGRSISAMQVWDVRRTVEWAIHDRRLPLSNISVYGRGEAGMAGLYAAVLDPTIGHVILRDPPVSHLSGFALPTILRDSDIDEVAGLVAPRPLTLIASRTEQWPIARSIYDASGANKLFTEAPSLAEAILGR